jgi:cobalt-zinc-cadmium efflux system outer membrane protein
MRWATTLMFVWVGFTAMAADTPEANPLSLEQLVSIALDNNPNLLSAQARWDATKNKPARAGALANPMFTFRGMDMMDGGDFPDTNEKRYEVEQSFRWFGKRGLQKQAAEKEVQAMQHEYETMIRDIILDVKETYYELCAAQQILKIAKDEENVLNHLEVVAQSVYAGGKGGQQDVLKAQSELTLLKPRLLEYESQINALKSKLNVLLGRSATAPLSVIVPTGFPEVDVDIDFLRRIASDNRPEIARAGADLDRSQIERRLMAKEFYPDYRVGAEYRTFETDEPNQAMFMVGIDIPIWQNQTRAGVREAERMIVSSRSALEAARKQADLDVQQSAFNVKAARQTLNLYRNTLIPQAEARLRASEAGYKTGTESFLDLIESERFLLNAKITAATAEANLGKQLARLERALGTDLKNYYSGKRSGRP